MSGYRNRLALMALLFCTVLSAIFFVTIKAQARIEGGRGQAQAQPTPTREASQVGNNPGKADRPLPPIIPRLLAPPLKKRVASAVAPVAMPVAPVLWEEPVGPASHWQYTENYLILGTDRRAGDGNWRTDTIMVVGLDRAQQRAAVFSIPRDLYVEIPNFGYGRINQADFLGERNPELHGGGPQLVSKIISRTLGIQTNHWVRFQMDGFVRVVDAVGGVTVHLDCPFYEPIFNLTTQSWEFFTLPAGDNQLDGDSAYWFVRLRLRESDIGRSARQRQFLWALRDKMLSANLITRFPELWGAFQESFATDLGLVELIDLVRMGTSLNADNVRAGGLTLADLSSFQTEQGASVLGIDNPGRVRAVVNGVWDAPTMASSYRRNPAECPPVPQAIDAEISGNGDITITPAPDASTPVTETTK